MTHVSKPIRVFSNNLIEKCKCGSNDFFTLTCEANKEIEVEHPNGVIELKKSLKIIGLVYFENVISVTICVNCNRLQHFSYPSK